MKYIPIQDFKKFLFLFRAGGGEFKFSGLDDGGDFLIKMKRINKNYSELSVAWQRSWDTSATRYKKYAKADFKNQTYQQNVEYIQTTPKEIRVITATTMNMILGWIKGTRLMSSKVQIYHTDHCCRCGKKLTNQESIKAAFGPECEVWAKEELPKIQLNLF